MGILRSRRPAAVALLTLLGACSLLTDTDGLDGNASPPNGGVDATTDGPDATGSEVGADSPTSDGGLENDASGCAPGGLVGLGAISNERGSTTAQFRRSGYALYPSVMIDGPRFMMWYAREGNIELVESANADGPWHAHDSTVPDTFTTVLSGASGQFDRYATSPSVIRVNGVYYAYYAAHDGTGKDIIATATSGSGIVWTRRSAPIFTAKVPGSTDPVPRLGAPSAFHWDGLFYLLFADPTAPGAQVNVNGDFEGQYLVRSSDPAFQSGIESFTWSGGWVAGDTRTDALVRSNDADAAFVPELDRVAVVYGNRLALVDLNARTVSEVTHTPLLAIDHGFIRHPDGTMRLEANCAALPVDLVRAVGDDDGGNTTDLARYGFDVLVR